MAAQILGLHHITAIAGNAQRNYDFYTQVLGLRLVKKTVNFDDPGTYHFYFGDESGTPGTILTFFPWQNIGHGSNGVGMATEIAYSVPEKSFDFWKERFAHYKVKTGDIIERFGQVYLPFFDPDGLALSLVGDRENDRRKPWVTDEVGGDVAAKGFFGTSLMLSQLEPTARVLTDIMGYRQTDYKDNRYRFVTEAVPVASVVDVVLAKDARQGRNAGGTIHHIAFRVKDEDTQMSYREKLLSRGLHVTPKIDRDYFYSLYFREPGGVLFEIATDNPGFTVDEPITSLGSMLKLPKQYEPMRRQIEGILPKLNT